MVPILAAEFQRRECRFRYRWTVTLSWGIVAKAAALFVLAPFDEVDGVVDADGGDVAMAEVLAAAQWAITCQPVTLMSLPPECCTVLCRQPPPFVAAGALAAFKMIATAFSSHLRRCYFAEFPIDHAGDLGEHQESKCRGGT